MAKNSDNLFEIDLNINTDRELNDITGILKLDRKLISAVAARGKDALTVGVLILILAAIANIIGSYLFTPGSIGFVLPIKLGILSLISNLIYIFLLNYIAEKFMAGKANLKSFAKPMAYGYAATWLNIIYLLQFITSIWVLVISYHILRVVHGLDPKKSVIAIVLASFIGGIIISVLAVTISL